MRLDSRAGGGAAAMAGADSIEKLVADFAADTRLDANERCLIARGAGEWNPDISAALIAGIGGCPATLN